MTSSASAIPEFDPVLESIGHALASEFVAVEPATGERNEPDETVLVTLSLSADHDASHVDWFADGRADDAGPDHEVMQAS